jgi:hypothetical protein
MARRSFVQINGKLYERGVDVIPEQVSEVGASVHGDIPDFVSPIDGTVVRGRAGMRDHCARHSVVPTQELKGLPPKPMNMNLQPSAQDRQQTRQVMADIINSRGYFRGR